MFLELTHKADDKTVLVNMALVRYVLRWLRDAT